MRRIRLAIFLRCLYHRYYDDSIDWQITYRNNPTQEDFNKTLEVPDLINTISKNFNVDIYHDILSNYPYYDIKEDYIILLPMNRYFNPMEYYHSVFHELSHWTGRYDRCNRDMNIGSSNEIRAHEECIADLSAAIICWELQYDIDYSNLFRYINRYCNAYNTTVTKQIIKEAFRAATYILTRLGDNHEQDNIKHIVY